jgi:hypothetical protein
MATHDYIISNASGAAVRADLNNALAAIATNNSSATEPTTTYAYQWWADTGSSPTVMKLRNAANSAWITLFQLDGEWSLIPFENGTAAAPSIYFKDSGTDTGIYSPGTDQVGISAGGTSRFEVSTTATTSTLPVVHPLGAVGTPSITFTGDLNTGIYSPAADTIAFVEGGVEAMRIDSSSRVGIGTTSPFALLHVKADTNKNLIVQNGGADTIEVSNYNTGDGYRELSFGGSALRFNTGTAGGGSSLERGRFDASGRFLVGTSTARANIYNSTLTAGLQVEGTGGGASRAAISVINNDASDNPAYVVLGRSRTASIGSNTALQNGDWVGILSFQGNDGTEFVEAARIDGIVDGTPGANDMPGRLVFSTTADGASSPTERAKITNEGYFKATTTSSYVSSSGSYHELRSSSTLYAAVISNMHASAPAGLFVGYGNADPNNTTNYFLQCAAGSGFGVVRAEIRSNGGLANYSANNVNLSDRNVKKDITPAAGTWDCLKEWEIVNFRYKDQPDDADLNMGVIAQQVAESCPEVITVFQEAKEATEDQPAQEERIGVKEQQMMWMAIKALQEAQLRIETLEAEVAALKRA